MLTLLIQNLFRSNKPITYLSLIEKAKADYSFYTKLASGSFFVGVSSLFSFSSWLSKIPLITWGVFGTSYGAKGIMESNEQIKLFTQAHEATKVEAYLATSGLGSFVYGTAIDKNGIDKFTGKYIEGTNAKIISNAITCVPTLSLTEDGVGYKHNGGYEIVESTDRALYQAIPGVKGQYTNKLVLDTSILPLHACIIQQLIQNGYSSEDIEKALSLGTVAKRESYKNKQLAAYKPNLTSKLWHGTEKAMQNKVLELSKEIQKYAEINKAYEELFNYHTSTSEEQEEQFYSLDYNNDNHTQILGDEGDGGYISDIA
ncbi:hypothetical protein [Rickettsia rickettsii]|uniref:Uncharacterized protein n=1 Tax=Rickettsia rickettsii (strain Sheila Smith) TaxID=392021 RepID=A0A0H3AVE5_RICRS|nr:hypothetical protein [Rickettsia rickettsii]ABV75817.1 hypothetical protein A1G_01175 [Rickettsia rickettsii str. 'Sheila Smith']AJG32704.1 hypothetical protein RRR_01155 [Rickettsia rickettsii str. R]WGQ95701.1 hypothetical protein QBX69_01130 [Rickettsia rickettsii str. 'Sheila Smith']